jgi:hypothetical protein
MHESYAGEGSKYSCAKRLEDVRGNVVTMIMESYNPAMEHKPKMKIDIAPLCLHHNELMVLSALTIKVGIFESLLRAYAYRVRGCNQKYSMNHGYFEVGIGISIKESRNVRRCLECREHLYLPKRGATTADAT